MRGLKSDYRISRQTRHINSSLYQKITELLPIPSVEAVIPKGNSILFLKRNNEPAKGQWWFPGGRIRKGETLEEALYREVKEETGLEVIESKFLKVYSRIFAERHDITVCYLCKCKSSNILLNGEHSEFKYFRFHPTSIHSYLKQVLHDLKNDHIQNIV